MGWQLNKGKHTLWTVENAGLATSGQSLVEVRGKHGLRDATKVVVGKHVFLDSLATVEKRSVSAPCLEWAGKLGMPLDRKRPATAIEKDE